MCRRIFLLLSLVITSYTNCFAFITAVLDTVKWLGDQVNQVTEEVFRVTMIKQTIESVASVKRNYEESVKYYNYMKQIARNTYGFGEEVKQQFLARLENPVDKFWYEVDRKANEEPGLLGKQERKARDYIQKNWDFAEKVREKINAREKQQKELTDKLSPPKKKTFPSEEEKKKEEEKIKAQIEEAKNEALLLQTEQLSSIEKVLVKIVEIQNRLLEQQSERDIDSRRQQMKFQEDVRKMFEARYGTKAQRDYKSREEKIISILGETP